MVLLVFLRRFGFLWILPLLMAVGCGGGGSAAADSTFRISLNRSSLEAILLEGETPETLHVLATGTGTAPSSLYIGAALEGFGFEQTIPITITGMQADIRLTPRSGLAPGTYSGRVNLLASTDPAGTNLVGGTPLRLPYTVLVRPRQQLQFSAVEGLTPSRQPVDFSPLGFPAGSEVAVSVEYAASGSGWLTTTRTASGLDVQASAAQLLKGTYAATLVLTPPSPSTPYRVPVTFEVSSGMLTPASRVMPLQAESTLDTLSGSELIAHANGSAISWSATSSAPWLILTRDSGLTGTSLTFTVDPTQVAGLTNFADHFAVVTIQPASTQVSAVSFTVTLRKQLPEIQSLGPRVVITGQSAVVHLKGQGFDQIADLSGRLSVQGVVLQGVTRKSDTHILATLTPSSPGDHTISISNALGLSAAGGTLQAIDPQTYPSAAIPTTGIKRSAVFDPVRRAVFAVDIDGNLLARFRFQGETWVSDSVAVPSVLDLGLTPDGGSVMVTSTPGVGRLHLFDPSTLEPQFTFDHADGFSRNLTTLGYGISTTNDGRSWLTVGNGGWGELVCFDHRSRTFQPRPSQPGLYTSFYGGPWSTVSRDGERMVVVQSASISPQPPMLFLDASEGLLKVNGEGLTFTYWQFSLSDDGHRFLMDSSEVRDKDFRLVGRIPAPASGVTVRAGGILSPDGRRVYSLDFLDTSSLPKVVVHNAVEAAPGSTDLAFLGEIPLSGYPSNPPPGVGCYEQRMIISPDGRTLFIIGNAHLLVVPIPVGLR